MDTSFLTGHISRAEKSADRKFSGSAGMSLVELLVAVVIGTIALSSVMSLLTSGLKTLRAVEKQLAMSQQARLVMNRMVREIASGFHPYGLYTFIPYRETSGYLPWLIIRNASSALATGGGKEMSYVASLYQKNELEPEPANGDLCEIHYYLAGAATQASPRHLYRRKDMGVLGVTAAGTDPTDGPNIKVDQWASNAGADVPTPIGFNVRNLDFKVWDNAGLAVALPFTYDGTNANGYPSRIRIFVTFYDPDVPPSVSDMTFATDVSTMRNN